MSDIDLHDTRAGSASPEDTARLARALEARTPLVGPWRRRRALRALQRGLRSGNSTLAPLLVAAADSFDPNVARGARELLSRLDDPRIVESVCAEVVRAPGSSAAEICRRRGLRPSDPELLCLYLFVTGRLDEYFEEDYAFQTLRLAYDRADPEVKAQVLRVVRSGDRRCLGFLGSRKRLSECDDREISLALQSFLRHEDWPRLFQAFLELPVRYGFHVLRRLRRSGWEPDDPESRSLLRQALAEVQHRVAPIPASRQGSCRAFEAALDRGRTGPLTRLSVEDLVGRLERHPPLDGVSAVAALSARVAPDSRVARRVGRSSHWLVRLAGYATGLCTDIVRDDVADANEWVRRLAPSRSVLDLWPGRATPVHLEQLSSAPASAWEGGLGAARRLLRLLIARRLSAGQFEEMVLEGGAFAAEFEVAEDVEWDDANEEEA